MHWVHNNRSNFSAAAHDSGVKADMPPQANSRTPERPQCSIDYKQCIR
jgi:hypothetical protein